MDDEYDPKEWFGMGKREWYAFFLFARYIGAEGHYKTVKRFMPKFIVLGLVTASREKTQKGIDLYRKMNRYMLGDHGL